MRTVSGYFIPIEVSIARERKIMGMITYIQ
jgi:hypothetical protein